MWFMRRVESVLDNAVFAMFVIVAAAVVSALGIKKTVDVPTAFATGVFVLACLALAWNALAQIVERYVNRRQDSLTPSEIEARIWEWLKHYLFTLTPNADPKCDFSLNATQPGATLGVTVAKLSHTPWISITTAVRFEDDRRKIVEERAPLLSRDIAVELVKFGVEHEIELDADGRLALLSIRVLMPFDASTTDLSLMKNMAIVRGGAALSAELYKRVYEEAVAAGNLPAIPPPSKPNSATLPPKNPPNE